MGVRILAPAQNDAAEARFLRAYPRLLNGDELPTLEVDHRQATVRDIIEQLGPLFHSSACALSLLGAACVLRTVSCCQL